MEDEVDIKLFRKESKPKANPPPTTILSYPISKYGFEYNMRHPNRGKAHIFNQSTFSSRLKQSDRAGTDLDRDRCYAMLTQLGFEVEKHNNPTLEAIEAVVRKESSADHSDNDCIAFVILSHGNKNGEIYAYDKAYELNFIYDYLTPEKCPSLLGKPKLFFVQACRGHDKDKGIKVESTIEYDSFGAFEPKSRPFTLPLYTDLFVGYATLPGFVAWRNTAMGSPFIRALCETFSCEWKDHNILTLMTLVIQRVAINYEAGAEQFKLSPCFLSNLTRVLKFSEKVVQ